MSYLVLARKFRPQAFAQVSGQEHVTRTLGNAIKRNKVAHAYLFAGPRGVGKTSIARIFAKCLNCVEGPTSTPCLECANCVGIAQGTSLAVREIDGASHNSVENVRDLIDSFRSLPAPGSKYKIYIIDEVHMLSTSAFNALLKSLEEPPPHTVFILATTEAHKIPDTVISRCQRHDLRALSQEQVEARLAEISVTEKLNAEPGVYRLIARLSDGSMRDAQSLLERVCAFCDETLTLADAGKVLGVVDRSVLFRISAAIFSHAPADALRELNDAFSFGVDPSLLLKEFVAHWRELLVAKVGGDDGLLKVGISELEAKDLKTQVAPLVLHDLEDLVHIAREGADNALRSAYPKYALEALLVRMATRENVQEIGKILSKLKEMPQSVAKSNSAASIPPPVVRGPGSPQPDKGVSSSEGPKIMRAGQVAPPPAEPAKGSTFLRWEDFVSEIKTSLGGILVEQLKRLSIEKFQVGELRAKGPEFSVTYLLQAGNREKLERALTAFAGGERWIISIVSGVGSSDGDRASLYESEKEAKTQSRDEKTKNISNHPQIQSLQRAFPGSTIENIKLKDN